MPRWQAMYVSVNEAACTSLKWLVADVQQESRERFHRSLASEISRTMTIHRRSLWQNTPMAKDLTNSRLAAISPEQDWFVFGVVRHPTARLFSAWQSKLLLREPWWVSRFGKAEWFPRIPSSSDDIVDDFGRFVRALADGSSELLQNRHFAPQHQLLATDRMRYSRIYKTTELMELLGDFDRHLRTRGWDGKPLALRRANDTPLTPIAALFEPEVLSASWMLYEADFSAFGYDEAWTEQTDPRERYSDSAVAEVSRLIERTERIGDLAKQARRLRAQADAAAPSPASSPGLVRRLAAKVGRTVVRRK